MSVILETSIGDITVDLYVKERPGCCLNFLKLCKIKYYNFHLFHTIQENFVAQTGDPTGTGRGGESIFGQLHGQERRFIESENRPRITHLKMGTLSMVNDGNDRHGSQFFITLVENADYLDGQNHTVFGEVTEGFDILTKLNNAITDDNNRPLKDIRIFHTVILDDPFPDPPGLDRINPEASPVNNTQEQLEPRIGVDEDTDEEEVDPEKLEEINQEREARTNAQMLELIGDIPDADVRPPDNVLFVCKLNPVTTDEDLEIIFSRFGTITTCEIIRNKKTNESLQYAFIEFEREEDCEKAYFKMDNVLIDDRRIHVDFSQSVSKIKWDRHKSDDKEDESKPQYRVKDFEKRNDGYDYVFEEPVSERLHEKPVKVHKGNRSAPKKDHRKKDRHSSPEEVDRRGHDRKGKRKRSSSGERSPKTHRDTKKEGRRDRPSLSRSESPSERNRSKEKRHIGKRLRSPSREHSLRRHRDHRKGDRTAGNIHGKNGHDFKRDESTPSRSLSRERKPHKNRNRSPPRERSPKRHRDHEREDHARGRHKADDNRRGGRHRSSSRDESPVKRDRGQEKKSHRNRHHDDDGENRRDCRRKERSRRSRS